MAQLFSLTIPAHAAYPGGTLACTEPAPAVYLLTLNSPPDNRLTAPVLRAFLEALDIIEFGYPHGVVATTSGIPKFYSNGLDLEHAVATEGYWPLLYSVWRRFLRYINVPLLDLTSHDLHQFPATPCPPLLSSTAMPLPAASCSPRPKITA